MKGPVNFNLGGQKKYLRALPLCRIQYVLQADTICPSESVILQCRTMGTTNDTNGHESSEIKILRADSC